MNHNVELVARLGGVYYFVLFVVWGLFIFFGPAISFVWGRWVAKLLGWY